MWVTILWGPKLAHFLEYNYRHLRLDADIRLTWAEDTVDPIVQTAFLKVNKATLGIKQ